MSAVPAPETGPDAGAIWHYGDPLGEQRAAETDAVLVDRSHRGVLTLTGADRQTWLHSISTQHVSELPDGASTQNLSLDGQGRVEDHWIQTELGGVTYLDTEPWRGEPLLGYLRKMVFWSEVTAGAGRPGGAVAAGAAAERTSGARRARAGRAARRDGCGARDRWRLRASDDRGAAGQVELDVLVDRRDAADLQRRLTQAGVRPAGVWAYEAHRVAAVRPRLGVDTDERTIPHEVGWIGGPGAGSRPPGQGLLSRPGDRRAGAQPGQTAADAGVVAPRRVGRTGPRPAMRCWPAAARSAGSEPWSTTSIWARWRWRCSSAGYRPTPN